MNQPSPRIVKIRLLGEHADIDAIVTALSDHLDIVTKPSRFYPNRRDTGVRVYLEAQPR